MGVEGREGYLAVKLGGGVLVPLWGGLALQTSPPPIVQGSTAIREISERDEGKPPNN